MLERCSKEAVRHFCERPFLSDAWLSCAGTGELAPEIGFSKSDRESGRLTGEMGAHINFLLGPTWGIGYLMVLGFVLWIAVWFAVRFYIRRRSGPGDIGLTQTADIGRLPRRRLA